MGWKANILITVAAAVMAGCFILLKDLYPAIPFLGVALSIQIAAIFVRLNRAMPSLDWKSLTKVEREKLTTKMVELSYEYAAIIGLNAFVLLSALSLIILQEDNLALFADWFLRVVSGLIVGGFTLSVLRMGYVIWRDIDIIQLQKILIDQSATRDELENEQKQASAVLANIRDAKLKAVPMAAPKAWGE